MPIYFENYICIISTSSNRGGVSKMQSAVFSKLIRSRRILELLVGVGALMGIQSAAYAITESCDDPRFEVAESCDDPRWDVQCRCRARRIFEYRQACRTQMPHNDDSKECNHCGCLSIIVDFECNGGDDPRIPLDKEPQRCIEMMLDCGFSLERVKRMCIF